jgi:hypothetical protein
MLIIWLFLEISQSEDRKAREIKSTGIRERVSDIYIYYSTLGLETSAALCHRS